MKYLLVSDIHGSKYYTDFIVNRFLSEKFDYLILLGDILYHGPRNDLPLDYNPKEVIKLLNPLSDKIIAIKGNCDAYVDQMVLNFNLADDTYLFINNRRLFLTHGHIFNKDNLPKLKENDILIYGHFHVPFVLKENNLIIINPGSISIPKENSKNSFIEIINNTIFIKDIDLNILDKYEL